MIQPFLRLAICVLCFCHGIVMAHGIEGGGALSPANEIVSAWDVGHACGAGATIFNRRPDQAKIIESKAVRLPEIGYEFSIPQLPGVKETVASVTLNDQARGVVDHYLLISRGDLTDPVAAIVVTKLPAYLRGRANAFTTAREVETGLATAAGVAPVWTEISGPYGEALEMLVTNRLSSPCYPTSTFQIARSGSAQHTLGISRFALINDDLVEFSLILDVQGMSATAAEAYARRIMDGFWLGIKLIGKDRSPEGASGAVPARPSLTAGRVPLRLAPWRSSTHAGRLAQV